MRSPLCSCVSALLWVSSVGVGVATPLSQIALQDLCGQGGNDVDHQDDAYVAVKAYAASHTYNRKALFLFNLCAFGGRDLTDQYVHSATFTAYAYDAQCDGWVFRLYGLTDTASNDDSRWDETVAAQSEANWPDRYWGAYQYPDTSHGAALLDRKAGPAKDGPAAFSSNLLHCVRWGVGREPAFGYSATNPDGKFTLLLAREDYDGEISQFHSRQSGDTAYRPCLALDVRFPEVAAAIAGVAKANGSTYTFGSFQGLGGPVARSLVLDNLSGEALSSLHVRTLALLGSDAWAFQLVTPGGTNFYLAQGSATSGYEVRFDPQGQYGLFDDARLVLTCNDEDESSYTVYLSATHTPPPPGVTFLVPAGASTNVTYRTAALTVCGGSSNIAGRLWWANSAGGGGEEAPGPGGAWDAEVALAVGSNLVTVSGTNIWGAQASDSVTIIRADNIPALAVTNPAGWFAALPHTADAFTLAGTAGESAVGSLHWRGPGGAEGDAPAGSPWSFPVPLAVGVNAFTVVATNDTGQAVTGAVTLVRQPADRLSAGGVVLPGWLKSGGAMGGAQFLFATFTNLPAGTVLYFTDNGAFRAGGFLGAAEGDADGLESLCAVACAAELPAGAVIRSGDPSNGCVWAHGGRICAHAPQSYAWPTLDTKGDQLYAFQSEDPNPLLHPDSYLAALDDTGAFEPPFSAATGDVPPGLVAGYTAWTFAFGINAGACFQFANFVDWISTDPQWRARFASSKHWLVNPVALPSGRLLFGELLLLSLAHGGDDADLRFTCAYAGVPCVIEAATNLARAVWEPVWTGSTAEGPQTENVPQDTPSKFFRVYVQP